MSKKDGNKGLFRTEAAACPRKVSGQPYEACTGVHSWCSAADTALYLQKHIYGLNKNWKIRDCSGLKEPAAHTDNKQEEGIESSDFAQ